jgi:hypothetical protein
MEHTFLMIRSDLLFAAIWVLSSETMMRIITGWCTVWLRLFARKFKIDGKAT